MCSCYGKKGGVLLQKVISNLMWMCQVRESQVLQEYRCSSQNYQGEILVIFSNSGDLKDSNEVEVLEILEALRIYVPLFS